jgi:hypothetical protein
MPRLSCALKHLASAALILSVQNPWPHRGREQSEEVVIELEGRSLEEGPQEWVDQGSMLSREYG